jgi:3'-5' exoribonuclease
MKSIAEFKENEYFTTRLLIANVTMGTATSGSTYLNLVFQDKSGSIEGRKWDVTDDDLVVFVSGVVVEVEVNVVTFRNALQLKVVSGAKVDKDVVDIASFVKDSPIPQADLIAKLNKYLASIKNPDVAKILNAIIKDYYQAFVTYPAAVRNHHEFRYGLLHHSMAMADLASAIQTLYPQLNYDLLIAGTILHDIGKTLELSGPLVPHFSTMGKLVGHISIMSGIIYKYGIDLKIESEVPLLLQHMILSHHGKKEFGSPVLPLTREAIALHFVDDFDASMMMADKALDATRIGEFSTKMSVLDERMLYNYKKI